MLAVDAVVSTAAVPLFVDRWKIDAVVAGTQKAIGAPPGLALTSYSSLAKYVFLNARELFLLVYFFKEEDTIEKKTSGSFLFRCAQST